MFKWLRGDAAREHRPRRVAVIDAIAVDRNRSVVLVRRDNIEHLLIVGGRTDMVVEANIVRATAAREWHDPLHTDLPGLPMNCPTGPRLPKARSRLWRALHRASMRRLYH